MNAETKKHLLIVDDEISFLLSLCDGLQSVFQNIDISLAQNGKEALNRINKANVDLMLLDLKMPVMDGYQLLNCLEKQNHAFPILIMTAYGTSDLEEILRHKGIVDYLEKPLDLETLINLIIKYLL